MKKYIFGIAFIASLLSAADSSAQCRGISKKHSDSKDPYNVPEPHLSIRPHRQNPIHVSYDESSTILTVDFSHCSNGGTVEVYRDGVKVSAMTAGGGTTFSCVLNDYGEGDYDIIVSRGNTVVYSRNVIVR